MPGCCAVGCTNSTGKGYKLHRFPAKKSNRDVWIQKISRKGWTATNNSRLCEVHFENSMYEVGRADRRRKLKWNAFPTLFAHRPAPKHRKLPKTRNVETVENNGQSLQDHLYYTTMTLPDSDSNFDEMPSNENACMSEGLVESEADGQRCSVKKSLLLKLRSKIKELENELKAQKNQNQRLKRRLLLHANMYKLNNVFGEDQLKALGCRSGRGIKWSKKTVQKAMQLRFACGEEGYKMLLKQNLPFPSVRTLQRKMQHVSFQAGILDQVFEYLKLKVNTMTGDERLCCLTMDEMAITPGIDFDANTETVIGHVNLPGHSGVANHVLVFMLSGVTCRWKQPVEYFYTGSSTNGTYYKPIILDIIHKAEKIGLHVVTVTSDMGSANRCMWASFGVHASRQSVVNKIQHPENPDKYLYFLADVPHLIKNAKSAFIGGQDFTFAEDICRDNKLSANTACVGPLKDLAEFQQLNSLKLAPNLNSDLFSPGHFETMKVGHALHVFSNSVSAGIRYMVETENRPTDNLTTAWFIGLMNHWFDLMSSRSPVMALSRFRLDKYREAIQFLQLTIQVFNTVVIGKKKTWKPVQTGIVLSTTTVIELATELLDGGLKFVLTSRLTQDCLENLFSSLRINNPVPSPIELKQRLRLVCMAQYMNVSRCGSYEADENEYLVNWLDPQFQYSSYQHQDVDDVPSLELSTSEDLSTAESHSLYYLCGYCVHSVTKQNNVCGDCTAEVLAQPVQDTIEFSRLTELKDYQPSRSLVYVSTKVMSLLTEAEKLFRCYAQQFPTMRKIKQFLVDKIIQSTTEITFKSCHDIKHKILAKYFHVRIRIHCKNSSRELKAGNMGKEVKTASKSQAKKRKNSDIDLNSVK